MTPTTSQLEIILDRLAKVERQNRRLRWIVAAGFLLPAAVLLWTEMRTERRVEAREFVLRDSSGAVRARLAVRDGQPRLVLFDSQGAWRAALASSQSAPGENSEPQLAQAGFSSEPWLDTSFRQGVSSAGLLIWSALHPLLPRLAALDGDSSKSSGNVVTGGVASPRGADPSADSTTGPPQLTAQFVELPEAPSAGGASDNQQAPAPGDPGLAPPVERSVSRESRSPQLDTSLPNPPVDLPLIRWAQSRAPQAAPNPGVDRNPFEFAGETPGVPRPLGSVPVAPSASLPSAPPVTLKALGYAESAGSTPQAIISDDVSIYVVRAGDSFAGRFQVLSIDPSGVDIDDRLAGRSLRLAFNP